MDSDGIEGVVLSIEESPFSKAVARVCYPVGSSKPLRLIYADSLTPAPLDKPKSEPTVEPGERIKSGDKVQHTTKIHPLHRRTDGIAIGSILSNGTSISVLWPGGLLRTELLSQLEVAQSAKTEDVPHKAQEIIDLIDAECEEVRGQIATGHAHLRALVAAKSAMMEIR